MLLLFLLLSHVVVVVSEYELMLLLCVCPVCHGGRLGCCVDQRGRMSHCVDAYILPCAGACGMGCFLFVAFVPLASVCLCPMLRSWQRGLHACLLDWVFMHVCVRMCVHVCMYVCMHVCMLVCMRARVY